MLCLIRERFWTRIDNEKIKPPNQLVLFGGYSLVQFWCNWHGKDGFCALDGLNLAFSIERMDCIFPHGKDYQISRPIRNQTPVLSSALQECVPKGSGELRVHGEKHYTAGEILINLWGNFLIFIRKI